MVLIPIFSYYSWIFVQLFQLFPKTHFSDWFYFSKTLNNN